MVLALAVCALSSETPQETRTVPEGAPAEVKVAVLSVPLTLPQPHDESGGAPA